MARSLDLLVTAEGVETAAQADFLRALECHYLQGFHTGRPLTVEAFTALILSAGRPALRTGRQASQLLSHSSGMSQ
jgi:EAL domain-containing protein (putative c-di-GMP-specific phosphodiesterase class I)